MGGENLVLRPHTGDHVLPVKSGANESNHSNVVITNAVIEVIADIAGFLR